MMMTMKATKPGTHPQKYLLWIAIASIVMMFAGLSSAFIVKRSQANWLSFDIPLVFYYSTGAILLSSVAIMIARSSFIERKMSRYTFWLATTIVLGVLFVIFQIMGFTELWNQGVTITRNVSFSFLYVIVGLHALHVLGGLVALVILFIQSMSKKVKVYSTVGIDIMSTYWHFVDLLWLYLLIFLAVEG